MRFLAVVLAYSLLLGCASLTPAEKRFIVASSFDSLASVLAAESPNIHEANPLVASLGQDGWQVLLTSTVLNVAWSYGSRHVRVRNPRTANVMLDSGVIIHALGGAVAVYNLVAFHPGDEQEKP